MMLPTLYCNFLKIAHGTPRQGRASKAKKDVAARDCDLQKQQVPIWTIIKFYLVFAARLTGSIFRFFFF